VVSEEYPDVRSSSEPQPPASGVAAWFGSTPGASAPLRLWLTLLVFALALGLRLVHLSELQGTAWADERPLINDSQYYDMRASEIASGELIGAYPGFLSPVYCYVLGAVYSVTGSDLWTAKLFQIVFAALSIALVHRIARRIFCEAAAVVAAVLLAAHGPMIYYSALLLPATLVFGLHALLVWVLLRGELTSRRALCAGALVGLAIGAKANALLLLPVIGLWLFFQRGHKPERSWIRPLVFLALGAVLTITPITWRNYQTSGEFVLVTTTGGRNLLKGNGEDANGSHVALNQETIHIGHYLDGTVDIERAIAEDHELRDLAFEGMLAEPVRTLGLFGKKLLLLFNHMQLGIRDDFHFAQTQTSLIAQPLPSFALIVSLGLVGLVLYLRESRGSRLLGWILLSQIASFVLVFVLARYRMVTLLVLAPFAGQAVAGFFSDLGGRRIPRALVAALLMLPALWFVRLPIEGFEEPNPPGELHNFVADWHFERGETQRAFSGYNKASKTTWRIASLADHWAVRARIADCYDEMGRRQKAVLVRETLLAEVEAQYPFKENALKQELLQKLGRKQP